MIFDAILTYFQGALMWVVGLFPETALNWSPQIAEFMKYADGFINMPLLLTVTGIFISYELTILVVRLILWVYKLLPLT